jgi:hypothetical protein
MPKMKAVTKTVTKSPVKLTIKQQYQRDAKKYPWGRCADGTPRKKPGRRSGKVWHKVAEAAAKRAQKPTKSAKK